MLMPKYVIFAQWLAVSVIAGWGWILAQAQTFDTVDRWLGGSVVVTAAVTFAWFTLKFSTHQKDSWTVLLNAANARADDAVADRIDVEHQLAQCRRDYDTERKLRISLEKSGLTDRRKEEDEDGKHTG